MYKGSEAGAPGVTLYEADADGRVHRQVQIHADGVRFSPEDILLRQPVRVDYMAAHPDAEEISADEFERHWAEFDHRRRFRARLLDPWRAWEGRLLGGEVRALRWIPSGASPGEGWRRVPGFVRLFVRGDEALAWATQRELFLESPIEWDAAITRDLHLTAPVRQIVPGLSLARGLVSEARAEARPRPASSSSATA
jgi:hypothetical protein